MASLQHSVDDEFGLGQMRRARDIRDHPARAGTRDGSEEQFLLQRCELSDMSGLASPARLRSASEDTETRAGCIDEHSVEAAGHGAAVCNPHVMRTRNSTQCLADEIGPMWLQFDCGQGAAARMCKGREESGFAAGARTEIEPLRIRSFDRSVRECEGDKLRSFVLHRGSSVDDWSVRRQ